jgi:hypothetical protein
MIIASRIHNLLGSYDDPKRTPERRQIKCQEEMEQAPKAKDLEPEEDRGEVPVAAKAVQAVVKAVRVAAGEVVLGQVRVDFASAPTAVNEPPTNREVPVMSRNVPSAKQP